MAPNTVYLEDGRLQPGCNLTPQQALTKHSAGIYTTALITPDGMIVDWELHRQRLLRGIEVVNTRPSRPFQPLLSALEGSSLPAFLDREVVPRVKEALTAFYSGSDGSGLPCCQSDPQQQSQSQQQLEKEQQQQQHAMLAIIIAPRAEAAAAAGAAEGAAGGREEPVGAAADCGGGGAGDVDGAVEGTSKAWCGSGGLPVAVAVYCKAVQPPPYGEEHAIQAAVMGRPRSLAPAKACSWVEERRRYEAEKPSEAGEVLLFDSEGRITEGLTTNFFVISVSTPSPSTPTSRAPAPAPAAAAALTMATAATAAPATAAPASAASAAPSATLQGCGPGSGEALSGLVAARVVAAAQRLGLRVQAEPPRAQERGSWSEAFVSNCIRSVQPVRRVFCPPGNVWNADPWDCQLPFAAGPHTTALLEEVRRMQIRTHWSEL